MSCGSSYGAIGAARRRPDRGAVVAGRIELREQVDGAHPHRPVLVGERLLRRRGAAAAPYSASADEDGRARVDRRRPPARRQASRSASTPPAGFSSPISRAAVARTTKSGSFSCASAIDRGVRRLELRESAEHGGDDAPVLVLQHRPDALERHTRRQGRQHVGQRRANGPLRSRLHADRTSTKLSGSIAAAAPQRRRAHRRPRVGQKVLHDREPFGGAKRAERGHRFEADMRIAGIGRERHERGIGPCLPDAGERADRRHQDFGRGVRRVISATSGSPRRDP